MGKSSEMFSYQLFSVLRDILLSYIAKNPASELDIELLIGDFSFKLYIIYLVSVAFKKRNSRNIFILN